jgi:hypothetical protein
MGNFEPKPAEEFDFKDIIYEKKDYVAKVTINRPEVYNAYSILALREMGEAFKDASWDDSIAVLILTGAGDKAFCTGGDVKEYADNYTVKPRDFWKWMGDYNYAHDMLRNCGKPTIARVNGVVAGGGNPSGNQGRIRCCWWGNPVLTDNRGGPEGQGDPVPVREDTSEESDGMGTDQRSCALRGIRCCSRQDDRQADRQVP